MNPTEFQTALATLTPAQFEHFVFDVLRVSQRFAHVLFTPALKDAGVDIVGLPDREANPSARKVLVEAKHRKLVGIDVARYVESLLVDHPWPTDQVEVILAVSGSVTREARAVLQRQKIEVLGPHEMAPLVTSEIAAKYFGTSDTPVPDRTPADRSEKARAESFITALRELPAGTTTWSRYQHLIAEILEFLFCPPLDAPRYEFGDAARRNRRDLVFENGAADGFWSQIRSTYDAHYIVADAKNYSAPLKKGPVVDIAHYLKPHGCGMFALLVSRKGAGGAAGHAIREEWIGSKKMIVCLGDDSIEKMLAVRGDGGRAEEVLRRLIADFRMAL